jgi:YVTN family beta-propeller protein
MNTNDPELDYDDFKLLNRKGDPIIYFTDDATLNELIFSFVNNTGKNLTLKGRKNAKPNSSSGNQGNPLLAAADDASAFNFNFRQLLTNTIAGKVTIDMPNGWGYKFLPGTQKYPPSWSLAPEADLTVKDGDQINFVIRGVICLQTEPIHFDVGYCNIPGYPDSLFPFDYIIGVQKPPDKTKDDLPLTLGYTDVVHPVNGLLNANPIDKAVPIYISYQDIFIENGLTLLLTNDGKKSLVVDANNGNAVPEMYIYFRFGKKYYHITTQELADNGKISIDVSRPDWKRLGHISDTAYWKFLPAGKPLIDAGETIRFPIHKIITPPEAEDDTVSVMYVQFNNIPGYNDKFFTKQLRKRTPTAEAKKITAQKPRIKLGENATLAWSTALTKCVTLEYDARDDKHIIIDSKLKLNETSYSPPIAPTAERTVFTLTAYDDRESDSKQCEIFVEQPEAVIVSFKATPTFTDVTRADEVLLTWEVKNAEKVILKKYGDDKGHEVDRNKGSEGVIVTATTDYILEAFSYRREHPQSDKAQVRIYACTRRASLTKAWGQDPPGMQPSPSILLNGEKSRVYVLYGGFAHAVSYHTKGTFANQYLASAMTMSRDGRFYFTYYPGQGNGVTMFSTETDEGTNAIDIGNVTQMVVTPDLSQLYCTLSEVQFGAGVLKAAVIDVRGNRLIPQNGPWVGMGPPQGGMCFDEDATKLFVGSRESVSMVTVRTNIPCGKIRLTAGFNTSSLCYHNARKKLYVAGEGRDVVAVSDTIVRSDYEAQVNKFIPVGNKPCKLLLSGNGQYLYVANFGDSTVSVIDTKTDTVVSRLVVGNGPIALTLNENNTLLFVANYCDKTISVVDLTTSPQNISPISTGDGGNPVDMVCFTENNNEYTRLYVAREFYPQRPLCGNSGRPNLNVAVFSFQNPKTSVL